MLKSFQLVVPMFLFLVSESLSVDVDAGEKRYHENCHNCHGPAGMGVASYPKVSGKDFSDIVDKLNRYRAGEKIGPNSALMISMAKKLSDIEIQILAAYLSSVK